MKKAIFKTISLTLVITHLFTVCLRDIGCAAEGGTSQSQLAAGVDKGEKLEPAPVAETSDAPVDTGTVSDKSSGKDKQKDPKPNDTDPNQITALATAASAAGDTSGASGFNLASFKSLQNDPFTGRATFSVPIVVPPGRRGLQPSVALTYASTSGNGIAGMGWNLELGSIERSTKKGIPTYTSADTFVFNSGGASSELVSIGGTEYRAKIEGGFMKLSFDGVFWKVWDKAGTCYFFGSTSASRQEKTASQTYSWRLDKVVDLEDNYLLISYVKDQDQIYPLKIEYTGNQVKGDLPKYKVEFTLEARADLTTNYRSSFAIITAKRIKEINVTYMLELVRNYILGYQNSPLTSRSVLTTITQFGADGTTNLPQIKFNYGQQGTANYKFVASSSFIIPVISSGGFTESVGGDNGVRLADVNGDGLVDILHADSNTQRGTWLNNGKGFVSTTDFRVPSISGAGFTETDGSGNNGVQLVDVNGDGLVDILHADGNTQRGTWLNNGKGFVSTTDFRMPSISGGGFTENDGTGDNGVRLADVNGDGLVDILQADGSTQRGTWLNNGKSFVASSDFIIPVIASGGFTDSNGDNGVRLADVNGDGLVDLIQADGSTQRGTWLNNGKSFVASSDFIIPVIASGGFTDSSGDNGLRLTDVNGDSLVDLVQADSSTQRGTWLNNGKKFVVSSYFIIPVIASGGFTESGGGDNGVQLTDVNGDGLEDLVQADGSTQRGTWLNQAGLSDVLISIDNGIGGAISITYIHSTKFQNTGSDALSDLAFPVPVVSSITSSDGQGNSYTTTYEYKNGLYDWQDREFRGFGYVKAIDAEGSYSETYFKQDDIYKGRPYLQQAKDASGNLYSKSESTWSYAQPYTGVYFPYLAQTDNYIYDGDESYKQTRARFEYDTYGNPTKVISEGDVEFSGDEKTQVTEYVYNTDKWLLAFPKYTYLLNAQGVKISQKWFYYDNAVALDTLPAQGFLTKEEVLVENPITQQSYKVAAQLSYDAYGNLKGTTDALGRTTTTTYETDLNIYPIKVNNALGQTVQSTYDYKTGQVLTSTDPNNQVTRNIYDTLGRLIKLIGPNDTESYPASSVEYQLDVFPTKITTRVKADYASPPNYLTSYEFFDGLGRSIQTKSPAEPEPQTGSPRQIVSGATVFDSRGQAKESYLPYFSAASADYVTPTYATPHASFIYDSMGRLIQQTNPDATYSTVSYSDWKKTTTDENGHIRAEYYDAYGHITKIEEYNQGQVYTTTYTYDTLGNLIKVTDNQNNISQIWYDSLGRKIKMDDPDMGVWTYDYDAVGNLIKQTDAKAQALLFDYDVLNRLTRKYTSTQTRATYLYDDLVKGNCIGRLSKIIDLSGSTEFFYDNLGREIKSIKAVSGNGSYTVERTYDALDRIITLKYPDGEVITYTYNPQGIESVQGLSPQGTVPYVSNTDYSATGQITKVNSGNGVTTNYTYNPNTLRLSNLVSQSAKGKIQDLSYQFDSVGNIKQIGDYVNTATQNFIYDDLDRLTQANGAYGAFAYAYDSIGNMLHKEGINLTYGKNGKLPHAVTQYGATLLNYDANGNLIQKGLSPAGGLSLTYDVENRLLSVNQSGTISSFVYDGDGGRVKKTAGASSTVYIGSLFEKSSSGKTTKYIFAGANRIASKESTGSTYYYHSDHLGSSNVVTDASATQVGFTEFTPYGSTFRKTGTYDPKFKFTGKELDNTGLYFYGARYYDPEIGRFISADTIVQAPYDPQSLNRYSYCSNNPINYVDPTGHSWFSKFFKRWAGVVGLAFGLVGLLIASAITGNWQPFQNITAATAMGFVTGGPPGALTAFVTSSILDTDTGREAVKWTSEEIFDDAFGMRPRAAYMVGNIFTSAVISSAVYIGITSKITPSAGQDYSNSATRAEIERYAAKVESGPGGSSANYIGKLADQKIGSAKTAWYPQGRVSSDIAFQGTSAGKVLNALQIRHAAAVVNVGGKLVDSAKDISLLAPLKGQIFASPWTGVCHQATVRTLVAGEMTGMQAVNAVASQVGWSFYLSSSIYGIEGHSAVTGIINAEMNNRQ